MRIWLVLGAAAWLVLAKVDGVLHQFQSAGRAAYGVNDLASGSYKDLVARTDELLSVWFESPGDAGELAERCVVVYTVVDSVFFIPAYLFVLAGLLWPAKLLYREARLNSRLAAVARAPLHVLIALGLADLVENGARVWIVLDRGSEPLDAPDAAVWIAWSATWAKWGLLAFVLILVATVARDLWRNALGRRYLASLATAVRRLRVQLLLSALFGAALLIDPTQQLTDLYRRWLDEPVTLGTSLVATGLLGFALWTSARRVVLAEHSPGERAPPAWLFLLAGGALFAVAVVTTLDNLRGFAIVLLAVAAIDGARLIDVDPTTEKKRNKTAADQRALDAAAPRDGEERAVLAAARAAALWPLVALGLATTAAFTPPLLILQSWTGDRETLAQLLFSLGLGLAFAAVTLGNSALQRLDAGRPSRSFELRHASLLVLVGVVWYAAVAHPIDVPPALGAIAVTAIALAGYAIVIGELQRVAEIHPPPAGLAAVGFIRTPVVLLLAAAFIIASLFNDDSYHAAYRDPTATVPSEAQVFLDDAWASWLRRNCADQTRPGAAPVPLILVGSHGGGLRAAYWTSSVLTAIVGNGVDSAGDRGCPTARTGDRIFAMSGISGGSLGIASWATQGQGAVESADWYKDALGEPDFASVPVSWALLADLPRNFVGWGGPDRARRLEESWEDRNDGIREPFLRSAGDAAEQPLLLLGGTQVESGCRFNVSQLRLSAASVDPQPGDCGALVDRPEQVRTSARRAGGAPAAPLVSELLDYACPGDGTIRLSTAALLSARFPYVSPSGRLEHCQNETTTAIVDGGYHEGTGALAALDLWQQLEPRIAAHNAHRDYVPIVPFFLQIDNHYAQTAAAGPVAPTRELVAPPLAYLRADRLDDRGIEQRARAVFSGAVPGMSAPCTQGREPVARYVRVAPRLSPGLPAPLAWTLSSLSTDDLDSQRDQALERPAALRLRLIVNGEQRPTCERG